VRWTSNRSATFTKVCWTTPPSVPPKPFLGLAGTRTKEPEIPLADLEKVRDKGEDAFLTFLKDETGRSVSALKKALEAETDGQDAAKFRTVCQGDDELWHRVEPLPDWSDLTRSATQL